MTTALYGRRRAMAACVASLALSSLLLACGSTVAQTDRVGHGDLTTSDQPTTPSEERHPSAGIGTTGGVSTGPITGPVGNSGGQAGRPGPLAPTPGVSKDGMPRTGRGYDARSVYVGFTTQNDLNGAAGNVGLKGLTFGDIEAAVRAIMADLNRRGGLLGRRLVPVFHDNKTADLQSNPDAAAQATCEAFTEDRPVVAVVNLILSLDQQVLRKCLAQRHTPLMSGAFLMIDDEDQRQLHSYFYQLAVPSFTDLVPLWLRRLTALRYFDGWNTTTGEPGTAPVKVGLLYSNTQPAQRVFAALKSQLSSAGYDVAREFQYNGKNFDAQAASIPGAVLPFQGAGVTHVISDRSAVLIFMLAAENQHYRPRYALNSLHALGQLLQVNAPAAQLAGSLGIGWIPGSDVDARHDPGDVSSAESHCKGVLRAARVDTTNRNAELAALELCDAIHLWVQAAKARNSLVPQAVRSGVASLGQEFRSTLVFRSAWSATRSYGPGATRDIAWNGPCKCFAYLGSAENPL